MTVHEAGLAGDLQGSILKPAAPTGWGVVVLAGSSGRVDVARARLFAALGATCIALRWFGGEGQPPGICEVPLEAFTPATDRLIEEGCDRVAYVGTSKGAEAALLVAIDDPRVRLVAAISPSSVVWANTGPGMDGLARPQRSSWTRGGRPLPFVAYDETWQPAWRDGLVTYRSLYDRSLQLGAANVPAATIAVEKVQADILLVAGGDDALWPSDMFARSIEERLASAGRSAPFIHHPNAGHRLLFPGETTTRSTQHAHGGSDEADAELGRSAWDAISARLRR
jgi:acetyl esterase/lipase